MELQKKNRDPEFWLMRRRNGQAPSAATSAIFKAEAEGRILTGGSGSLVRNAGQSLGPGGRRLKAVDKNTNDLFGDDDEDGEPRRRKKEDTMEGDMDEMLFDEEFADDDEGEGIDNEDEEAKELEVTHRFNNVVLVLHRYCITGTAQEGVQERQQAEGGLC
jgi:transcription initiation factor TFIIF subunit alpha